MVACGETTGFIGRRTAFATRGGRASSLRSSYRVFGLYGRALEDARDDCISEPKKIIAKLHANWGHAAASRLKRVLADSECGNSNLVNFADDVLEHCDVCKAYEKAPHVPIAGTSPASTFNEKVQVGLRICFPRTHYSFLFSLKTRRRFGLSSVVVGWAPSAPQGVSR